MFDTSQSVAQRVIELVNVVRNEVGQLFMFFKVPQMLGRVQFRRVGREHVQIQPGKVAAYLPHRFALVHVPLVMHEHQRSVNLAQQAAKELLAEEEAARKKEELAAGRGAEPLEPDTHASREAPAELIALAAREPERFIGKTLVLDDGVNAVEVGPVLDLRRRIKDGVLHVVVDATAYFNSPTHYAVAVRDLDRIDGDLLVTPEAAGMHLRGLDYYPEDYTDVMDTSPADVLADNVDESDLEDGIREEPGEIEIRRF